MLKDVFTPSGELDVRVLVPIKRHELLLQLFKELPVKVLLL